jgi:hypothetical protein
MVTPEPAAFPVMVEVRRASLADSAFPALLKDGTHGKAAWGNPGAYMWAPSGVIPTGAVSAIHFRSNEEREEFEAREFADARPRADLHRVTSRLFEGDGPSADAVTEWLRSLEPVDTPSSEEVAMEDRRSGAVLLGALTAVPREAELAGWGHLLAGRKTGRQTGDVVSRIGRVLDGTPRAKDAEDVALQICVDQLMATDRQQEWRPLEVLDRIRGTLIGRLKGKADAMEHALDRAAAILDDREPFEGLKASGSSSIKALLLALRRPEPERLMGWDPGGPGSTAEVLNLAAVMVGALTGRALTPVTLRGSALDEAVARTEANRLSSANDRAMPLFKPPSMEVQAAEGTITLRLGGAILVDRPVPLPAEVFRRIDGALLGDPQVRERAVDIAVRLGWSDAVETVVIAPMGAGITSIRSEGDALTMRMAGVGSLHYELLAEPFLVHVAAGQLPAADVDLLIASTDQR